MDGERENREKEVVTEVPIEFRLEPWLTPEQYNLEKANFQEENIGSVLLYMKEDLEDIFSDLTEPEFNKAAELISIFQFGVYMAYKRVGLKDLPINVGIALDRDDFQFAAYDSISGLFLIKKSFLTDVAKDCVKDLDMVFDWSGMENMTPNQMYEIAGMEEAAHSIFHKAKGDLGRNIYETQYCVTEKEYFSSEIEYRAFFWKSAYVKRYFPEHHESIKNFITEIEQIVREKSQL